MTLEGFITRIHETRSSPTNPKERVVYFEVSNFTDSKQAEAERVVYKCVSRSDDDFPPIHNGDTVVYNSKLPYEPSEKAIVKGKIVDWNSIHPRSKPFFVACSSEEYISNHLKNIFKDLNEKSLQRVLDSFQEAANDQSFKSTGAFLTWCACNYVLLREQQDVSPNVNSMISKTRFDKTLEKEKEKKAAAVAATRRRRPPTRPPLGSKKSSSSAASSKRMSLIFSGLENPFEDLADADKKTKAFRRTQKETTSQAAEFIIGIADSKAFNPTQKQRILSPRQLELVIVTWHRNCCYRPLNLLGLNMKEIKGCANDLFLKSGKEYVSDVINMPSNTTSGGEKCMCICKDKTFPWCGLCADKPILKPNGQYGYDDLIDLYDRIVECPFAFKVLSMEKAISIYHSHRPASVKSVPPDHLFCGNFLRRLEEEKNSTCVEITGSPFEESFKKYESLLNCVYGVFSYSRADGRKFAYLFERCKIEKSVANFISDCVIHSNLTNKHRQENEISGEFDFDFDDADADDDVEKGDDDSKKEASPIKLTEEQLKAVKAIVNSTGGHHSSILTITGGPGSGKTTILKSVIEIFKECKIKYRLSAFTGKAVSRIKEKTFCNPRYASTLDRLIAKGDTFDYEHLIIDEASMVTSKMLYRFLMARKAAASFKGVCPPLKITLVGDPDQLPPIEWGNLFTVLLDMPNEWIPSFRLKVGFRVSTGNEASNAIMQSLFGAIRSSSPEEFCEIITSASEKSTKSSPANVKLIQNSSENGHEDVIDQIKKIKDFYKVDDPSKFGVFSPYNKDVNVFNSLIRRVFINDEKGGDAGGEGGKVDEGDKRFSIGDRVIMTKNIYFPSEEEEDEDDSSEEENGEGFSSSSGGGFAYMNGDTGIIVQTDENGIYVDFDTGEKNVFFQWQTPSLKSLGDLSETLPDLKEKPNMDQFNQMVSKMAIGDDEDSLKPIELNISSSNEDLIAGAYDSSSSLPLHAQTLYVDLLKLAFSLTVHKSQGSEYDHVIVHVPKRFDFGGGERGRSFVNRNLIYTALTRARKTVTIVTPGTFENEIASAISAKPPLRIGNLGHRIVDSLFENDYHHLIVAKDDELI